MKHDGGMLAKSKATACEKWADAVAWRKEVNGGALDEDAVKQAVALAHGTKKPQP